VLLFFDVRGHEQKAHCWIDKQFCILLMPQKFDAMRHRAKRELNIYVHTIAFLAKEPILKEASELVPKARLWSFPNRVKIPKINT
jgi:hypothetical protein